MVRNSGMAVQDFLGGLLCGDALRRFSSVVFMINGLAAAFFLSMASSCRHLAGEDECSRIPASGDRIRNGADPANLPGRWCMRSYLASRWFSPKIQMRLAVVLSAIAIAYPILRMSDLFPTTELLSVATDVSPERSASLEVRFEQEQQLLAHASERFWFGWGRYGRSRIYDDYGNDISITDGQWIVTFGQFGIFGFLGQFGLLTLPVFLAWRAFRLVRSQREAIFLSCFTLIVALTAIEQLPNASISSWSWLLVGGLLGRCSTIRAQAVSDKRTMGLKSRQLPRSAADGCPRRISS